MCGNYLDFHFATFHLSKKTQWKEHLPDWDTESMWECLHVSYHSAPTAKKFPKERERLGKAAYEAHKPEFTFLYTCTKGLSFQVFANKAKAWRLILRGHLVAQVCRDWEETYLKNLLINCSTQDFGFLYTIRRQVLLLGEESMLLPYNLRAIGVLNFSMQGSKTRLQKAKDTAAGKETVSWKYSKKGSLKSKRPV